MNPSEELKLVCAYILAVAEAPLPAELKYGLIFNGEVSKQIEYYVPGLWSLYWHFDDPWEGWESYEEELKEYIVVIEKLLADLEKIGEPVTGNYGEWV